MLHAQKPADLGIWDYTVVKERHFGLKPVGEVDSDLKAKANAA